MRVMVAAVDNDEVFDPTRQVQLAVEIETKVAGRQPTDVVRGALGMAAVLEARLQLVAERALCFLFAVEVSAADVVAVQPDFPDYTVADLRAF